MGLSPKILKHLEMLIAAESWNAICAFKAAPDLPLFLFYRESTEMDWGQIKAAHDHPGEGWHYAILRREIPQDALLEPSWDFNKLQAVIKDRAWMSPLLPARS